MGPKNIGSMSRQNQIPLNSLNGCWVLQWGLLVSKTSLSRFEGERIYSLDWVLNNGTNLASKWCWWVQGFFNWIQNTKVSFSNSFKYHVIPLIGFWPKICFQNISFIYEEASISLDLHWLYIDSITVELTLIKCVEKWRHVTSLGYAA